MPTGMAPEEIEDGLRTLAGRMIRREIYELDAHGIAGAHPIRSLPAPPQAAPAAANPTQRAGRLLRHRVLSRRPGPTRQAPGDPRVTHQIVLALDDYDQPLREVAIAYPRRAGRPRDVAAQVPTAAFRCTTAEMLTSTSRISTNSA
jgi:hypothetical protein